MNLYKYQIRDKKIFCQLWHIVLMRTDKFGILLNLNTVILNFYVKGVQITISRYGMHNPDLMERAA
jgi:hypothetical protein